MMKDFNEYITEASQIAAVRKEADAVRRRTVAQLEKKVGEAEMRSDTKRYWRSQIDYYKNLNFNGFRSKPQLDNLIARMKVASKDMDMDIKDDQTDMTAKQMVKKMRSMRAITLCDIMKSPDQRRFIELLVDGASEAALKILRQEHGMDIPYDDEMEDIRWMISLQTKANKLANWFSQEGGPKQDSISVIRECMACRERGAWSKWSGKAYRGIGRSMERIKRYKYTGETLLKDGSMWVVANINYKGKYGAQSWTPNWNSASGFNLGGDVQVVLEVDLKEDETFLRPEVIEQVSEYKGEKEVIRVSDRMVPAKAYVKLYDILNHGSSPSDKSKVVKWAEGLFGSAAAKKLLANKAFMKQVI